MYNKYKLCSFMMFLYILYYYNESYNFILILYLFVAQLDRVFEFNSGGFRLDNL